MKVAHLLQMAAFQKNASSILAGILAEYAGVILRLWAALFPDRFWVSHHGNCVHDEAQNGNSKHCTTIGM